MLPRPILRLWTPAAYGHFVLNTLDFPDVGASWTPARVEVQSGRVLQWTPAARALGGFPRSLHQSVPRQCRSPGPEPRAHHGLGKGGPANREEIANGNHA